MKRRPRRSLAQKALIDESLHMVKADDESLEEQLRRSNDFLDSVIENIPHMIFVKDAEELRFVRFNRAGEKLLGYPKSQMIGKNDYDFFPQAEADFFTEKDREVLRRGKEYDIPEEPIHTKNNGVRFLHTKKIPVLDKNGRARFLLGISEDITERKELEREISEISDREQRRIGQDLHDGLGQHLTGVAFLCKSLATKLAALGRRESRDAVQIAKLINEAIARTRNLAHVLNPIELETGDLRAALETLASNMRRLFDLDCLFEMKVSCSQISRQQAIHLYRIVQEAVDNAVKHGKAKKIRITIEPKDGQIELSIIDDGRGFKTNKKFTGMGLHNLQNRTRMLNGKLFVESKPGAGAVIRCRFKGEESK